jgi:hypothetical protein
MHREGREGKDRMVALIVSLLFSVHLCASLYYLLVSAQDTKILMALPAPEPEPEPGL